MGGQNQSIQEHQFLKIQLWIFIPIQWIETKGQSIFRCRKWRGKFTGI